jgi:hypothetical protein
MADNGSGVSIGLIVGILLLLVIGVAGLAATGWFDFGGGRDVNVNIDMPNTPAPKPN